MGAFSFYTIFKGLGIGGPSRIQGGYNTILEYSSMLTMYTEINGIGWGGKAGVITVVVKKMFTQMRHRQAKKKKTFGSLHL